MKLSQHIIANIFCPFIYRLSDYNYFAHRPAYRFVNKAIRGLQTANEHHSFFNCNWVASTPVSMCSHIPAEKAVL